jgi:hypothetical protein
MPPKIHPALPTTRRKTERLRAAVMLDRWERRQARRLAEGLRELWSADDESGSQAVERARREFNGLP